MGNPATQSSPSVNILHADHGLGEQHLAIVNSLAHEADGFFLTCLELPEGCPDLLSALYGPDAGDDPVGEDEVEYVQREGRPGKSRLIDRPHRPCRRMVVCGIGGGDAPVVFTAYGTQAEEASQREWWDASMTPAEAVVAATWWTQHALAK